MMGLQFEANLFCLTAQRASLVWRLLLSPTAVLIGVKTGAAGGRLLGLDPMCKRALRLNNRTGT